MLSVPGSEDPTRRPSLPSQSGRRGSYTSDDGIMPRSVRLPPRYKPPLDEATLAARQQYAAHGLVEIMRRKMAKRRRVIRKQTSTLSGDGGEALAEEHTVVLDVAAADDDDNEKVPVTMTNSYIISAIPYMSKPFAAVCLVLNIILPGSGTVIMCLPDRNTAAK